MLKVKIIDCVKKAVKESVEIEVFIPEKEQFGHYSTNVALKLAKLRGENPLKLAEEIKISLSQNRGFFFKKIEVAAPGFINFWLSEKVLLDELREILKQKENYGKSTFRQIKRKKIQIEFVSANPTGPLTLANGRGGFLGDALSNILEFLGHKIEREYYINDTGNQILTLGKSILANVGFLKWEEKFYKGEYVGKWARKKLAVVKKHKNNPLKIGQAAAADFLKEIKTDIKKAGISFSRWTSEEKDIRKKSFIEKVLAVFKKAGLTYKKDNALWLKTTDFGDEKDRVLITSDNFPTYFLADAGHYLETKKRGFGQKIIILGPDHHGYAKRIQAAAKIIGFKKSEIIITQSVTLVHKGQKVKMSKRKGEFATFGELVSEVGKDAARFLFLLHSADSHMDFDLDLAKEQSMKNPVYYAQYAGARIHSIFAKINFSVGGQKSKINFDLLNTKDDVDLIRILARFPEAVVIAAENYNPQILARYSLDLARQFHNFYEKERVLGAEKDLMAARLELIKAAQIVFENLFRLLGIAMPKKM